MSDNTISKDNLKMLKLSLNGNLWVKELKNHIILFDFDLKTPYVVKLGEFRSEIRKCLPIKNISKLIEIETEIVLNN